MTIDNDDTLTQFAQASIPKTIESDGGIGYGVAVSIHDVPIQMNVTLRGDSLEMVARVRDAERLHNQTNILRKRIYDFDDTPENRRTITAEFFGDVTTEIARRQIGDET